MRTALVALVCSGVLLQGCANSGPSEPRRTSDATSSAAASLREELPSPVASVQYIAPQDCPVTVPNLRTPPGERPSPNHHGEGEFYTSLWSSGVVLAVPTETYSEAPLGWLEMKWPWFRPVAGAPISVEGRRLDGPGEPVKAYFPQGYAGTFQASILAFSSEGCWEITADSAGQVLRFVIEVQRGSR